MLVQFFRKYFEMAIFPAAIFIFGLGLIAAGYFVSPFEFVGVLLSILGAVLVKKQIANGHLIAIMAQLLIFTHFWRSDAALGALAFSFIWGSISVISYYNWTRGRGGKSELKPSNLPVKVTGGIFAAAAAIVIMHLHTGFVGSIQFLAPLFGLAGHMSLINKKAQGWLFLAICFSVMAVLMWNINSWLLFARNIVLIMVSTLAFIKWRK